MKILKVPQGVTHAITIPMYRVNTPNVLPLATMGRTLVIVIIIPCQTPQALKSLTY